MACTVEACEREATRKGAQLCEAHYYRVRRGTALDAPIQERNRTGRCSVEGCERAPRGTLCHMHRTRKLRHGDFTVRLASGPPAGLLHPSRKDLVTYHTAHQRLARLYGRPSLCESCGASGQRVYHWALDHRRATTVLASEQGPYSLEPSDYIRLCVPCHKRMDLERAA